MNLQTINWKKLTLPFDENISDALQQQHHASQFIALVGRHLISREPDDSNTNMEYLENKESLIGNPMADGLRIGLDLTHLNLNLYRNEPGALGEISLAGKTKKEVFSEFKSRIAELGVDSSKLINELHYEIPDHPLDKGATFTVKDHNLFKESVFYRHNAESIIREIAAGFKDASPVKVWPHHFDTGTYIPLNHNNKGDVSKSIGLGWAIPDAMIDEPYYYLSLWSEDKSIDFNTLPALESGNWILSGWQGGVLKHSDILKFNSAEEQLKSVKTFFSSGIEILS